MNATVQTLNGSAVTTRKTKIKICGITRPADAALAIQLGADAVGLNFYPRSSRFVSREAASVIVDAVDQRAEAIGVFVNATIEEMKATVQETGIRVVQLHGDEPAEYVAELAPLDVVRAFRWKDRSSAGPILDSLERCRRLGRLPTALLLDTHRQGVPGGTGSAWTWDEAKEFAAPVNVYLAGGLTPENVATAIRTLRPYAVDVAGGVESAPGLKDEGKMRSFVAAVRSADAQE